MLDYKNPCIESADADCLQSSPDNSYYSCVRIVGLLTIRPHNQQMLAFSSPVLVPFVAVLSLNVRL